jgi:hypothetical protein
VAISMVIQKVYFIAIYLVEVEYRMEVTTKLLYPLGGGKMRPHDILVRSREKGGKNATIPIHSMLSLKQPRGSNRHKRGGFYLLYCL